MMGDFMWWLLPWAMFDEAQRRAVSEYGYESPEWYFIRDLSAQRRDEIGG